MADIDPDYLNWLSDEIVTDMKQKGVENTVKILKDNPERVSEWIERNLLAWLQVFAITTLRVGFSNASPAEVEYVMTKLREAFAEDLAKLA